MEYDDLEPEQSKTKRRKALQSKRPDLGAANDKRSGSVRSIDAWLEVQRIPPAVDPDPTPAEINAHLDKVSERVTIQDLVDKYSLPARKVRAIIRNLGYNAKKSKDSTMPKYSWKHTSKQLAHIESILKELK